MRMSLGATKLPIHHISIRVPWHDANWDGTVCRRPSSNAACLILKAIRGGILSLFYPAQNPSG